MLTTVRAALSVVMLLGFYVFALAIVAALGWVSYLLWVNDAEAGAVKFSYVTIVVAAAVLIGLWRVARAKPEKEVGLPIGPDQAPELWQTVADLAATAQTRRPDRILLIPAVNAAVSEDTRLLGLIGGTRRLYLGIPVLQGLTVAQLRSVLAHELGHYSGQHTRLGAIVYRGRDAMQSTLERLSGFSGWLLRLYAKVYVLVAAAVNRRQELEADELSVAAAGRATAQSALRELPVLDAAWSFYEQRYIDPGWELGYAPRPEDFFTGFGHLLRGRSDELAGLRTEAPPSTQSRWDSHPSIAARIAVMDSMPEGGSSAFDPRPASAMIPGFEKACAAVATSTVAFGGRTQLGWDDFTGVSALSQDQRTADLVYRAAARLLGTSEANLESVFGLVSAGRLRELAVEFFPDADKGAPEAQFAEAMEVLLRVAAVRSQAARWSHSWFGPANLVGPDGAALDLASVARLAVAPQTLADARSRISALGIDVTTAQQVDKVATAQGAEIVGALANVKVDGRAPHDVFILSNGLILRPCPKSTDDGKDRLIATLRSAPVTELAATSIFIPYEEISAAQIHKPVPLKLTLTFRNGKTMSLAEAWTGESLTKECRDNLRAILEQVAPVPAG